MSLAKMVILVLLICLALSAYAVAAEEHVGTASWYWGFVIAGNKFYVNGHYAAMWGVPLGTRVRVTNLENSRSIVVTINDRGPNKLLVAKGRIIDLAAKAFYDLTGSFKSGPIKVKVEILEK